MTPAMVIKIAARIRETPGYHVITTRRCGLEYAILVHEDRTGWEQWVHTPARWQQVATQGFPDLADNPANR